MTAPIACTCARCGRPFLAKRSTARFCRPACRVAALRTRLSAGAAKLLHRGKNGGCNAKDGSEYLKRRPGIPDGDVTPTPPMLRLVLHRRREQPWRFTARLGGKPIVTSHQPLVGSARVLLGRGYDPATLLTARHAGSAHDSFPPRSIGEWAGSTYTEGAATALKRLDWRPSPFARAAPNQAAGPAGIQP